MQGGNPQLLATGRDVLSGKHGGVGRRFIAVGFAVEGQPDFEQKKGLVCKRGGGGEGEYIYTFMPPVTRAIVSRPLESPRISAFCLLCAAHKRDDNFQVWSHAQWCIGTHERSVTWTKVSLKPGGTDRSIQYFDCT